VFGTLEQQLLNGVTLGGLYALIALGYTLVYGIMLMINFAHSEMFTSGAYVGYFVLSFLTVPAFTKTLRMDYMTPVQQFFTGSNGGKALALVITFATAAIVVGFLGVLIERFAYRPLRHAPRLAPLISAIGVSIFIQNAIILWISPRALPMPTTFAWQNITIPGGATINVLQILIIATAGILLLILDSFISRTRMGKAMRATSQDRDAAGLMGISINSVIALAFFIGPALGAVAGVFAGMYYGSVKFDMGFLPGMKSFTAAVIGGIGNLRGAMLGGLVLGILESIAVGFLPNGYAGYRDVFAFGILILVLIFRPGGLLGESVVEKV
jgi:branched-chain amino acid transport system permease protein